jgi:IclR family transcriptional regulator, KDG regulon repressor
MSSVISKSVARAFSLLELFRREQRPLTATDIEQRLALPQASALVLARELSALGYLVFDSDARTYFPSGRLADLAGWLAPLDLPVRRLGRLADEVARLTQETSSLCSRNGRHLQIEHVAAGTLPGSILLHCGRAAPLPCTGAGRAVLATLDDETVSKLVGEVKRRDPAARFDAEDALRAVQSARRRGHLASYDLMISGVGAVSFPLPREEAGGHFALVVAGPSPRIRANESRLASRCLDLLRRRLGRVPAT